MSLAPHTLTRRRSDLREVLELSSRATDAATRYFALSANVVAAIQAGDVAEANTSTAEADAIAAHYDLAPLRWSAMARLAWRTGLAGELDRAEQLIREGSEYGNQHGIAHARQAALLQGAVLRWQQHRMAEVLPTVRAAYDKYGGNLPGTTLFLARALAEDESGHAEARTRVSALAENAFAHLPRGTFWSSELVVTAETARMLGLSEVCRTIRDLLLPFVDQVAFAGVWVAAPIAYGVGMAAAGCGDSRAAQFFREAADIADRIHAPVLAALARDAA
jgi:hypothetical protein